MLSTGVELEIGVSFLEKQWSESSFILAGVLELLSDGDSLHSGVRIRENSRPADGRFNKEDIVTRNSSAWFRR